MRHGIRTTPRSPGRRRDTRGSRPGRSVRLWPRGLAALASRLEAARERGLLVLLGHDASRHAQAGVSRSVAWALASFFCAPRPRPCADSGTWTAHVANAAVAAAAVKSLFQFCITPEPGWRRLRVQVMSQSGALEMFAGESLEQGAEPLTVQGEGRGVA